MFHLVYKYLVLNGEVRLLGIGLFVLEREPARLDMNNKVIHAPAQAIKFKSNTTAADKNFYHFLAGELQVDVFQAIKKFQDFCYGLKEEVQLKKWVELPGMGILTQGVRDEIKFKSTSILRDYYPSMPIEKITRTESGEAAVATVPAASVVEEEETAIEEETSKPKDRWLLYALVLTLLAAAAIAYFYYYQRL